MELNEGDEGMVRKMFTKLGQDPTIVDVTESEEFVYHLNSMSENSIYS